MKITKTNSTIINRHTITILFSPVFLVQIVVEIESIANSIIVGLSSPLQNLVTKEWNIKNTREMMSKTNKYREFR